MASIVQHPKVAHSLNPSKGIEIQTTDTQFIMNATYDQDSKRLTVNMSQGNGYVYQDVPESTVQDFIKAPSKGSFYAKAIKGVFLSTQLINKSIGKAVKK